MFITDHKPELDEVGESDWVVVRRRDGSLAAGFYADYNVPGKAAAWYIHSESYVPFHEVTGWRVATEQDAAIMEEVR
jgi:hypothetical protein